MYWFEVFQTEINDRDIDFAERVTRSLWDDRTAQRFGWVRCTPIEGQLRAFSGASRATPLGGYAPAYVVHDWLFGVQHCGHGPDRKFPFEDSVKVMVEGLKADMEAAPGVKNYFVFYTVVGAVESSIARRLWEKGSCKAPLFDIKGVPDTAVPEICS